MVMGQGFTSTALAALMIGVATPVIAQSSDVARRFEIAAGPLDRSLPEFARQSGLQILYPSALVAGRQSPAVNGDLTSEVALTLLLRDSGLTYALDPSLHARRQRLGHALLSEAAGLVRAAGVEPAWAMPDGFSYHFDFRRRPAPESEDVRGLDYPFVIARRP